MDQQPCPDQQVMVSAARASMKQAPGAHTRSNPLIDFLLETPMLIRRLVARMALVHWDMCH